MSAAIALLRDPATIRVRAQRITAYVAAGDSPWFLLDESRLDIAAQRVVDVTFARYPTLAIPYHSRWRHFEAGGIDRAAELSQVLVGLDTAAQARSRIDLAIISVLLDAGAGADWSYREGANTYNRSEGLGVASFRAFVAGAFSSDPAQPLQVDGVALQKLDASALARLFQVDAGNPLVGLEGRAELLRRFGRALVERPQAFGMSARPGGLFDLVTDHGALREIAAAELLRALLDHTSDIWLAGNTLDGVALGDAWRHPQAGGDGLTAGWMPFHKLSQWLVYSLFEPFEWAGITITGRDALTGLPEYRNGGLLLDAGVITLRDPAFATRQYTAGDELIVEWRALTVALIDQIAERVRTKLDRSADDLPLACVLEGGTWAAGRVYAADLRDGRPPLDIASDGTVF